MLAVVSLAKQLAMTKAALTRHRGPDDPEVARVAAELQTKLIAAAIRRAVAVAPPLTPAQRDRLRALLDATPDEAA